MASVAEIIECPECRRNAIAEYFYKTNEEKTTCGSCGYEKSILFDLGLMQHITQVRKGYGTLVIKYKNDDEYNCESFFEPISEKTINHYRELFQDNQIDLENSRLIEWNGELRQFIVHLGNMPKEVKKVNMNEEKLKNKIELYREKRKTSRYLVKYYEWKINKILKKLKL